MIEQTPLTKYSNKAVTDVCVLVKIWDLSSKIGHKKRIAGKKNRWKNKKIGTFLEVKLALLKYIKFYEQNKQSLYSIHYHKG